jgi:glucosylceramidase
VQGIDPVAVQQPDEQADGHPVAHNENDNPSTFAVREGDQAFTYTLPGGALATFVWRGHIPGTSALRQAAPDGWTATANPPGPTDPCCTGDVAAGAVDGDASSSPPSA